MTEFLTDHGNVVGLSLPLLRTLLDNGLVDQLDIMLHPLVLGTGAQLFPDGSPRTELTLEAQSQLPPGVTILTYTTA